MSTPCSVRNATLSFAFLLAAGAVAASLLPLEVSAKSPLPTLDGGHLVFAVELEAHNTGRTPLTVRALEYTVSVQGRRLWSGSVQGFVLAPDSRQVTPVAGFSEGKAEDEILERLRGSKRFTYRVTGVVHAVSPTGVPVAMPFEADGDGPTPDDLSANPRARSNAGRYSLLNY